MKPERWHQIENLLQFALARAPAERYAFLSEACLGDETLRLEVESLVASHEQAESFLETRLSQMAAELRVEHEIELGGPEPLSPLEVVKIFEQLEGRNFQVGYVSEEALREQLNAASDPLEQSFAGLRLFYAEGNVIDMREQLKEFPIQLTTVRDFAHTVT